MTLKQALLRCAIAISALVLAAGLVVNAALWLKPDLLRVWIDTCQKIQGDKALAIADVQKRFPEAVMLGPDAACGPDRPDEGIHHFRYRYELKHGAEQPRAGTAAPPATGFAMLSASLRFDHKPTLALVAIAGATMLGLMTLIAHWLPRRAGDCDGRWSRPATGVRSALAGVAVALVATAALPLAAGERSLNGEFLSVLAGYPAAMALFLVVLAPLVEERLFRGRLLAAFPDDRRAQIVGLLVTSGAFASLHALTPLLNPVIWTTLFLAAISFGIGYLLTRDWRYPAIQHSAYNLTLVVIGYGTS